MSNGIGSSLTSLGPVQVRMAGEARGGAQGEVPASVNIPTVAEATAAVHRLAEQRGADDVVGLNSDYRRVALASGLAVQWRVEVMAWGTAVLRTVAPDETR